MKKRVFSFLLCLMMLTGLLPMTASAQRGTGTEKDPCVVMTYGELKDLMANAPTDGTVLYIKLGADLSSEDIQNDNALTLVHEDQNVVLDLAGYRITRSSTITIDSGVIRARAGRLTINDSVGTGGVYAEGKLEAAVALTSATVTGIDEGTIIINGGTYENAYSVGDAVYNEAADLYINGGIFKANRHALYAASGQTYVYGGNFYALTDSAALYLHPDQNIELYNLTAYGNIQSTDARESPWYYIRSDSEVFADGAKQTRTENYIIEGDKIEIRTDMVEMIWITARTPEMGEEIPDSVDIPFGANYEIVEEYGHQLVVWAKDDQLVTGGVFEGATAYTLRVYVKVNAPLAPDFGAWVNGQQAQLRFTREEDGAKFYWVDYTFPETIDPAISSAAVTLPQPAPGQTATAGIIDTTEKYSVSIGWSTTKDGMGLNNFNDKTFAPGRTYFADIYLAAEDPYFFADAAIVTVNGVEYAWSWANSASQKTSIAVYDVPFTVSGEGDRVIRLAGANRWDTALKIADEMKANLGARKFDSIIIASGNDFADALAGSYLSTVKNAPILLSWGKGGKFEYLDTDNIDYIKANLAEGGTVYILGGTNAVPELYENALKGYAVKRLGGANRFETNILILKEAGVGEGSEILVCTATNFADSLSASATGKPILLVWNEGGKLYGDQPDYLKGLTDCSFTIIGGENAVSAKLADALKSYGTAVSRLAGGNRFETSVLVAERYFEEPYMAVLAYAWNYPDGLCGGALAYTVDAPLILTMTGYESQAAEYIRDRSIESGIVLGGEGLISGESVQMIFAE